MNRPPGTDLETQPQPEHTDRSGLAGPLIPAAALAAFDDVVGRALGDEPRCADVPVSRLRPPLSCVPDLLDQVTEVLRGNPLAAEHLRRTLASFGGAAVPTAIALAIAEGDALARGRKARPGGAQDGSDQPKVTPPLAEPPRWDRLVPRQRLEPLVAAAVYVARDADELAIMLGSIQLGLTGVDEMQRLFDLAVAGAPGASLASAFETATRVMRWTGLPPGEPGSGGAPPVPGFQPVPGRPWDFGVPWFRWPPRPGSGASPRPDAGTPPLAPPRGLWLTEFFERCLTLQIIPELHRLGIGFREYVTGSPGYYVIESVEPEDACPGDTIVIRGSNFDGTAAVHFVDDRGRTVVAAPESVADDRVTVELPEAARTGPVSLYIPVRTRLCEVTYTMARPGRPGEIRVGRPSILRLELRHGRECVAVGDTATLVWSALPDDAHVVITQLHDGVETELDADAGASGELDVDTHSPGVRQYRIAVSNPSGACGDASQSVTLHVQPRRPTRIEIVGVEITQGIQIFSLQDPPPEPNNSIDLIAGMDTVLRVFVRTSYPAAGSLASVTGALRLGGNTYMPMNDPSPFIAAPRAPDRRVTDHSLNFLVPAGDASGTQDAHVEVFTTGSCADALETWTEPITWLDRPPLPVTIRRIADSGPAPNVLDVPAAREIVRQAFRRIPSPMTDIRMHPGVHQIREGTTEDNYCTEGGFYQLALSIAYEHNDNEGYPPAAHQSSWVGIYWQTRCAVGGMMAWPSTSTCITSRTVETVAHEILHTVGLGHTKTSAGEDCENVGQPVACHWLDHLTDGQLEHVPFDIDNNAAVPLANDLQSYRRGSPRWLSATLWVLGRSLIDTRY